MLVGGEWADTELVEAVVVAVVVEVSVEDFDDGCCCCCCVHTSETGRVVAAVGTTVTGAGTATGVFVGVADTPGEPWGVLLLLLLLLFSLIVCCDYCRRKENTTHI